MDLFNIESYDYDLPEELIAQNPADPRDSSRLMVLSRESGGICHTVFSSLGEHLREGDLLLLNDTRVIPARLPGKKIPGGGRTEALLLKALDPGLLKWKALVRPGRKTPPGTRIALGDGTEIMAGERLEEGVRIIYFPPGTDVMSLLGRLGETPLPPYITRSSAPSSYQTVFAKNDGRRRRPRPAFTLLPRCWKRLRNETGVRTAWLTLHTSALGR